MTGVNLSASASREVEKVAEVISVPRCWIRPFPNQPRKFFDQQKLRELAASIKAAGQRVPGTVKPLNGNGGEHRYELIDGQRRWHAIEMAGIERMKVIVTDVKDEDEQYLISILSNFGHAEHGPMEIAGAILYFRNKGMSVEKIAEIFGHGMPWVYQHLKVMELDPEVQKMMSPELPEESRLVFSVALMLADVPKDLQKKIADQIVVGKLKMVQARKLVRRRAENLGFNVGDPRRSPRQDYRNLRSFIGRTRRELELAVDNPQSFFTKMFQFRPALDHAKIVVRIEETIQDLNILLLAVKKAEKKG